MAKSQEQGYSFTLARIEILEKKINISSSQEGLKDKYIFDIALQVAQNPAKNNCMYQMKVSVKSKTDNQELAMIVLGCIFDIPNFTEISKNSESENPLPQDLMYLLNTVVIGTMRGVMFAEFRGTSLHDAYLPVLDPRRFEPAN